MSAAETDRFGLCTKSPEREREGEKIFKKETGSDRLGKKFMEKESKN